MQRFLKVLGWCGATALILTAILAAGCGDDSDDSSTNPARNLASGGVNDAGRCKDACDKVASCPDTFSDSFLSECHRACDQSGFFDYETIVCIEKSDCDTLMECGFSY